MPPRFYCSMPLAAGQLISLPAQTAHHAQRVLRMGAGDPLVLFDGNGGEWAGRLVESGRTLQVALGEWREVDCESGLQLTLVQALPAADKMDWVVQKAVELGATAIVPVQASRSVVRLAGERAEKRQIHWQQVIVSACEQCGRNRLPRLSRLIDLPHYLAQPVSDKETRLLLSPHQGMRLTALALPEGGVTLLVGPEGGFDQAEELAARVAGFQPVSLGPRVLRSETAGLAAIAAMMALWGDF